MNDHQTSKEVLIDKLNKLRQEVTDLRQQIVQDETELERTEMALKESEGRFQAIVDAIPIPMLISRLTDSQLLYVNHHTGKLMGVPAEELIGTHTLDYYNQADRDRLLAQLQTQGAVHNFELQLKRTDGKPVWVTLSIQPMIYAQQDALIVMIYDITERRKAAQALKENEQRFRTLADNLPGVVYLTRDNDAHTVLYINNWAERISGYSSEDFLEGRIDPFDLYHPDDVPKLMQSLAQARETSRSTHITFRIKDRNGKYRWVEDYTAPVVHQNEVHFQGVMLDITERKQAQEALKQRAEELALLNQINQTLATITDLPTALEKVAEAMVQIFQARSCAIALLNEAQTQLTIVTDYLNEGESGFVGSEIPVTDNPSTLQVLETKQPLLIPDAQINPLTATIHDLLRARQTESLLIVPLLSRGDVIGTIGIDFEQLDRKLTATEVNLAETISGQISGAIEIGRLFEQQKHINQELEVRVAQRTAELAQTNADLQKTNVAYSRFVPMTFLRLINRENILDVQLGEQTQTDMTIMFSDIRGFTSLSEQMTPQENFNFINAYFQRVSPVIRQHNGFVDKYIGDAIMALFPKGADDAVQAAIGMLQALAEYNKHRSQTNQFPIEIGIGLHTGRVMLGTVGETERIEGTVISDAVNLASRLEDLTKLYGASIIISEQTMFILKNPQQYHTRFLDTVQVKGKQEPVSVFEILAGESDTTLSLKLQTANDFETGLELYRKQKFAESAVHFSRIIEVNPDDAVARLYLKKAADFMVNGVPEDWIGIVQLTSK